MGSSLVSVFSEQTTTWVLLRWPKTTVQGYIRATLAYWDHAECLNSSQIFICHFGTSHRVQLITQVHCIRSHVCLSAQRSRKPLQRWWWWWRWYQLQYKDECVNLVHGSVLPPRLVKPCLLLLGPMEPMPDERQHSLQGEIRFSTCNSFLDMYMLWFGGWSHMPMPLDQLIHKCLNLHYLQHTKG